MRRKIVRKLAVLAAGLMGFSVLGIAFAVAAGDPHIEPVTGTFTLSITAFPAPTACLGTDGHHYVTYTGVTASAAGVTIPAPNGTTLKGTVTVKASFTALDQSLGEVGEPANGWANANVTLKKNGVVRFKGTATLVTKNTVAASGLLVGNYFDSAGTATGQHLRANINVLSDVGAGQLHAAFGANDGTGAFVSGFPSIITDLETC